MIHNVEIRLTDGQANNLSLNRLIMQSDKLIAAFYTAALNMPSIAHKDMHVPKSELTATYKRSCAYDIPLFIANVGCIPCSTAARYEYSNHIPDTIKRLLFDRLYINLSTYGRVEILDYVLNNKTLFTPTIVESIKVAKDLLNQYHNRKNIRRWN